MSERTSRASPVIFNEVLNFVEQILNRCGTNIGYLLAKYWIFAEQIGIFLFTGCHRRADNYLHLGKAWTKTEQVTMMMMTYMICRNVFLFMVNSWQFRGGDLAPLGDCRNLSSLLEKEYSIWDM